MPRKQAPKQVESIYRDFNLESIHSVLHICTLYVYVDLAVCVAPLPVTVSPGQCVTGFAKKRDHITPTLISDCCHECV